MLLLKDTEMGRNNAGRRRRWAKKRQAEIAALAQSMQASNPNEAHRKAKQTRGRLEDSGLTESLEQYLARGGAIRKVGADE